MNLSDEELEVLDSGVQNIGIFFRLETSPVIRIWLGFGTIAVVANVYDTAGAEYTGFGEIKDVPSFKQLINGTAERVEMTLSGVSGDVLAIASRNDAQEVKGKRVAIGFAIMGADWSLLGPIHWCANYTADYLSLVQQKTGDPKAPVVRAVTLSCGSLLTARRRPSFSYFTDQDQQARYPGDRFCERTPSYATEVLKAWPTFPA